MKRRNKPKKVDGVFVPNGQAASTGTNKSWSDNGVASFLEILSHTKSDLQNTLINKSLKVA